MKNYFENNEFIPVLIANLPQGIIITDENQNIVVANNKLFELTGVSPSIKIIGKNSFDVLIHFKGLIKNFESFTNGIHELIFNYKPVYGNILYLKNGKIIKYDFVPILNNNKSRGNIWLFKDETQEIKNQQRVSEQKSFYEDILNSIPVDIAVFSTDHRYLFLNPIAVKDDELRKWLIGKTDFDYCKLKNKDISIAEKRHEIFVKMLEEKKQIEWEEAVETPDGMEYHLRRMSPILGAQGDIKMVIGFGMEISEIKNALQKIEINEKRYRDLFNYSQAMICTHDMEGKLIAVNPSFCQTLGYTESEIIGKSISELLPAKDKAQFFNIYLNQISINKKQRGLFKVFTKDGRAAYLLYQNYCVEEPGAEPYVIAFSTDVTDRIKIEKELIEAKLITEEAAKAQELFLANMSHEIRTPMNGIIGITDLLLKTKLTDEQSSYLKIMEESAHNLLNIINDILDLQKITSGSMQLEQNPININALLKNIHQFFELSASQKGLELLLENHLPHDLIVVADATRLRQILNNLISNAIKFTHSGKIEIHADVLQQKDDKIEIKFCVKDEGIGIDPHKIDSVFKSFTQAYPETSRLYGGTGLGLTITKNLVELQDGNIWVESKIGKGSSFYFTLKFLLSQQNITLPLIPKVDSSKLYLKRILIAEDNEVNQFLARKILEKWGVLVAVASNGKEAIELVKNNDYDIILMDIQMPEKSGLDATREIRAFDDVKKKNIPIVALTANALKGEEKKYLAAGMNDYLLKPFKDYALYNAIVKNLFPEENIEAIPSIPQTKSMKLYDLTKIEAFVDGNPQVMIQLIEVFIKTVPNDLLKMQQNALEGNMGMVGMTAHKLKPTFDSFGLKEAYDIIIQLEKNKVEQLPPELVNSHINFLNDYIKKVCTALTKDYLNKQ